MKSKFSKKAKKKCQNWPKRQKKSKIFKKKPNLPKLGFFGKFWLFWKFLDLLENFGFFGTSCCLSFRRLHKDYIWPVHLNDKNVSSREDMFLSWHLAPALEVTGGHTLPF
jgi:hypothetical protein